MDIDPSELSPLIALIKRVEIRLPKGTRLTSKIVHDLSERGYDVESISVEQTSYEYIGLCEICDCVLLETDAYIRDPDSDVVWCEACVQSSTTSEDAPQ
ncbi:MAG: hypothetical protein ACYTBJ_18325 [Planctomycetota bacterium]|jgi:hypothetical protein